MTTAVPRNRVLERKAILQNSPIVPDRTAATNALYRRSHSRQLLPLLLRLLLPCSNRCHRERIERPAKLLRRVAVANALLPCQQQPPGTTAAIIGPSPSSLSHGPGAAAASPQEPVVRMSERVTTAATTTSALTHAQTQGSRGGGAAPAVADGSITTLLLVVPSPDHRVLGIATAAAATAVPFKREGSDVLTRDCRRAAATATRGDRDSCCCCCCTAFYDGMVAVVPSSTSSGVVSKRGILQRVPGATRWPWCSTATSAVPVPPAVLPRRHLVGKRRVILPGGETRMIFAVDGGIHKKILVCRFWKIKVRRNYAVTTAVSQ